MCKLSDEIVDTIIKATMAHGLQLTARCALVCHAWNIISRRHIFHTVALTSECSDSPSTLNVFENHPHLCSFVRQVNVVFNDYSKPNIYDPDLLAKFTNVREVSLYGKEMCLPPWWKPVPRTMLSMPSLRRLDLKMSVALKERVFTSILSLCSENLHYLIINLATRSTKKTKQVVTEQVVTMDVLSVLEIRQMEDGLRLGRLMRCPKLQELIVDFGARDAIDVSFPFVEADLRHLTVKAGPVRVHRLRFKKKIRVSHLTICAQRVYGSFDRQLAWTTSFTRAFTTSRPVSQLTILLEHRLPNDCSYPKAREYKPLCDFLRMICRRDNLTRVDIKIQLVSKYQRVDDFQAFKAAFWKEVTAGFWDLLPEEIDFSLTIEKDPEEMLVYDARLASLPLVPKLQ